MSESIPAALVIAVFLLITAVTFYFLLNLWVEHEALQRNVAAFQEAKIETQLDLTSVGMSEDFCPDYAGPYDAILENSGLTPVTDFAHTDVFVEYVDDSDNKLVSLFEYGTDWSVASLSPDGRNPNQWDPEETATIRFSLSPALKPDTNGVFSITSPQGISGSRYFTCPAECGIRETGFLSPTSEAADTGGFGNGFETTPTDAFADDGLAASDFQVALSGDNHRFYDYGFGIHSACEILGIEVRIDWWLANTLGTNSMDVELSWDSGTSWTAPKTDALETTVEHTTVLGSDSDDWGRTWSPDEFNDANFRVRVTDNGSILPQTYNLDWVAVNVHYAPP